MDSTSEKLHDSVLEDFEESWRSQCSGGEGILYFLGSSCLKRPYDPQALVELAEIDLERSWMSWHKELPNKASELVPAELLNHFLSLPRLLAYKDAFRHESIISEEQWRQLASCELAARNEWGDAIGAIHFQHHYGISLFDDPFHQPNSVQCDVSTKNVHASEKLPFRGTTFVGRQRSYDSRDYFVETNADGNRIVIASRLETMISREQLAIRLLHPKYAILENLSTVNPIAIRSDHLLEPGESATIALPHAVAIADRRLLLT